MQQITPGKEAHEDMIPAVSYVDVVPQPEPQPSISD